MRRLTQEVLIRTIEVAESLQDEYLTACRVVEGLAAQLPPSDLREAIIQVVTNPVYNIHEQMSYLSIERVQTNITRARNSYLKRRREEKAEGPYRRPEAGDDLDGFGGGPATVDFVDDETE